MGIATEAYQERKEELVREAAAKELTAKEAALSAKEAAQEVKNAADKAIQAEREKDVNLAQEKTASKYLQFCLTCHTILFDMSFFFG